MKRTTFAIVVALMLFSISLSAQTADCIATHPALTALDDATMIAAYKASFVGIYGRQPSMQPGSGLDDGMYWISVSNHYGAFGDRVCRAGWNAYWEGKLRGVDALDPSLGDQPAQFQPGNNLPPVPTPQPVPTPVQGPPGPRGPKGDKGDQGDPADTAALRQRIDALELELAAVKARPIYTSCAAYINLGFLGRPAIAGCRLVP